MSNSITHTHLVGIKNARFTVPLEFRKKTDSTLSTPTSPAAKYSNDGAYPSNVCSNSVIGTSGVDILTLTGAEMNNKALFIAVESTDCFTILLWITIFNAPAIGSGTLSAGSASGGTLGTILPYDVTGCWLRTTGGTGGGGTGGANNQARRILSYNTATGAFTVDAWETAPDATTTYDVLLPEGVTLGMLRTLNPATAGRTLVVDSSGRVNAFLIGILTTVFTEDGLGWIAGAFKKWFNFQTPTGGVNSLPDAVPNAAGGLLITATGSLDMDDLAADVDAVETRVTLALPNAAPQAAGGLVTSTAGGLDFDDLAADLNAVPTASQIAVAVRDVSNSSPAAGSLGEAVRGADAKAADIQITLGAPTDLGSGATVAGNLADIDSDVGTPLQAGGYTAPNNAGIATAATQAAAAATAAAAAKLVTDKVDTTLVQDGLVYQFTANALELGPTGGGGGGEVTSFSDAAKLEMRAALRGMLIIVRGPVTQDDGEPPEMTLVIGDDYLDVDGRSIEFDLDGTSLPDLTDATIVLRLRPTAAVAAVEIAGTPTVPTGDTKTIQFEPTAAETATLAATGTGAKTGRFEVHITDAAGHEITPIELQGVLHCLKPLA